jgi:protein-disulfide isomerase
MPSDSTRRRLLGLVGSAATVSFAGCATIAEEFSAGESTPTAGPDAGTRAAGTATGGTTTANDSDQVSGPGDATGTAAEDGSWSTESVTIDDPDVSFSGVPLPKDRSGYARMGAPDASATATLYGNWKCPYTQEFVLTKLPKVVDEFVRPGELTLEFRALAYLSGEPFLGPDAPRAAGAGLAVWDLDPESYWSYFAHVFANQPQERHDWAQPSLLRRFAEASGVAGRAQFARALRSGSYDGLVRSTTRAAADRGINTVPRIVADGRVTAPTVDFEETRAQLRSAVQG